MPLHTQAPPDSADDEVLARDLRNAVKHLENSGGLPPHEQRSAFHY